MGARGHDGVIAAAGDDPGTQPRHTTGLAGTHAQVEFERTRASRHSVVGVEPMPEGTVGYVVGIFDLFHMGHLDAVT